MQESGFLAAQDGTRIYWQGWRPASEPRAFICIAHGVGEHIERYAHLASFLNEKGFAVFGCDHRGHGRSDGKRGHVLSFDEYIKDYKIFRDSVSSRFSGKKSCLLGHSLGGLIAVHYALAHPADFDCLVLSSAAVKVIIDANPVKIALGKFFSKVLPELTMGSGLDANMISRDKEVVKKYVNDPLVHDRVSARWFTSFVAAIDQANARAGEIKLPALVMQSSEDKLVDPSGAREFFARLGSSDKTLQYWEGFYHEMFNETEKDKVYQFLLNWLEKHLA